MGRIPPFGFSRSVMVLLCRSAAMDFVTFSLVQRSTHASAVFKPSSRCSRSTQRPAWSWLSQQFPNKTRETIRTVVGKTGGAIAHMTSEASLAATFSKPFSVDSQKGHAACHWTATADTPAACPKPRESEHEDTPLCALAWLICAAELG